jgi:hypothetical protein
MISPPLLVHVIFAPWFSLHLFLYLSQLIEEENCGKDAASPEPSTGDEDSRDSGEEGSSGSSDDGSDGDQASGHEENSPKVDITE